ncbi:MAG: amino acid ABC transporter substrate-binding protein [Ruminococcaceae bacterium]|nr:amino acid ABC transporter substrate-binding protein [Oscillospiraceae bacterium]
MKSLFKKAFAVVMAAAMLLSLTACGGDRDKSGNSGNDGYTADNTTFKIGMSGPLTGGAAVYGVAVKNAAQMAIDEINAAGGLNGVKFELLAYDDVHDATKVEANYAAMYEAGMQVSLGCVTSDPCLEFSAFSAEDNVFFLTPSASNDDVPAEDNAYQMCFADGNQGKVAADYVNGLGLDKIGIFYKSDDSYSKGIYDQFKDNIKGIETVEASFTESTSSDFTQQISKLKDCSFIFMPIYYGPASLFMIQAKDLVAANTTYYGCDGFDGIESAEGFDINSIPQTVSMLSHFNSKATEGKAAEFIQKYTEKFGKDTLNQFGASAYDCVYAIFNAIKAAIDAGEEIDVTISASDLCEILKEQFQGGFSYSGVTGTDITWDENGYVSKEAVRYDIKK